MQDQLITDQDRELIQSFVEDMKERADQLPTYPNGQPRDDNANGAHIECPLFTGVTLIMDWGYLDAPSTYVSVEDHAPSYNGPSRRMMDCNELFDQLSAELGELLDVTLSEYDEANSTEGCDVFHCYGVDPY